LTSKIEKSNLIREEEVRKRMRVERMKLREQNNRFEINENTLKR
jgi:hypothetical protein